MGFSPAFVSRKNCGRAMLRGECTQPQRPASGSSSIIGSLRPSRIIRGPRKPTTAGQCGNVRVKAVSGTVEPRMDEAESAQNMSNIAEVEDSKNTQSRWLRAFLANLRGETEPVPKSLSDVWVVFLTHPSIILITVGTLVLTGVRASVSPFKADDFAVVFGVAAFWLLQEWVIHAKLLHSSMDWMGKRIHEGHHSRGYFHISIDPLSIIAPSMLLAGGILSCLFPAPLNVTATITYYLMGLLYEFNHYVVHTRYAPKSRAAKAIRRHHMLHHNRNPNYWLSFTVPHVDTAFGTNPRPSEVPHDP